MFSAIKAYVAQFKLYFIAAAAVALFLAGGTLAWKYQGTRLDKCQVELTVCHDVGKRNEATIEKMSADRARAESICQKQLGVKEDTARKVRDIDEEPKGDAHENADTDHIISALDRLFTGN